MFFLKKERYEKAAQSMTQKPLEEEQIQLFFSDIQPLPASKVLIQLEKENLSIDDRVLAQELQLTVRGQKKLVSSAQMVLGNQLC